MKKSFLRFQDSDIYENKTAGFTIVELVVVIIIIGILAAVTAVGYSGWNKRIIETQLKSDLKGVAASMENYRNFNDGYPSSIPSNFSPSDGISLTVYLSSPSGYCIDATSSKVNDLAYYIDNTFASAGAKVGSCKSIYGLNFKAISAGAYHTCAITSEDKAYCWGDNTYGQLGINSTISSSKPVAIDPTNVLNGKTVKAISAGAYHTCAITSEDKAYCWGYNFSGQLGNNSVDNSIIPSAIDPTNVMNGETVKSISAGNNHTCAVTFDGKAYCWGDSGNGQLGINSYTIRSSIPIAIDPTNVLNGNTVKAISAGAYHTCAITSEDKAYCWGYNYYGQLGINSVNSSPIPIAIDPTNVLNGKTVKAISAGNSHTCVLTSDDKVNCWGNNNYGQLGINSVTISHIPIAIDPTNVLNGNTVKSISNGDNHTCVVAYDSKAYCWGNNSNGQLGNDLGAQSLVPTKVNELL